MDKYITEDDRTHILIETIEDARVHVGDTGQKLTEAMANRLRVAFGMVLASAKRHPYWPKEEKPQLVAPWTPTPGSGSDALPTGTDDGAQF